MCFEYVRAFILVVPCMIVELDADPVLNFMLALTYSGG